MSINPAKKRINLTDKERDEMVDMYLSGYSASESSKKFGCSYHVCTLELKKRNIAIRPKFFKSRIYDINENFFENINTEEKAYWLGFITADGGVMSKIGRLSIGLQVSDIQHLEKFKRSIESSHPVSIFGDGNIASISIKSKKMVRDLNCLGILDRKSYNAIPCDKIPEDLQRHYWRGLVDGDGCLSLQKDKYCYINLCGTYEIVSGFKKFCDSILKNRLGVSITSKKSHTGHVLYTVSYAGKRNVKRLSEALYGDACVFLDRKKNISLIFQEYNISNMKTRKSMYMSKDDIIDKYNELKDWKKVAEFFNMTKNSIYRLKNEILGLPKFPKFSKVADVTREDLTYLYSIAGSWNNVANILKISRHTLWKLKKRMGILSHVN